MKIDTNGIISTWGVGDEPTNLNLIYAEPNKLKLIEKITLTEDVDKIIREYNPDGTSYKYSSMFVRNILQPGTDSTSFYNSYGVIYPDKTDYLGVYMNNVINPTGGHGITSCFSLDGYYFPMNLGEAANTSSINSVLKYMYSAIDSSIFKSKATYPIKSITFYPTSTTIKIPAGSIFEIYGREWEN